MRVNHPAGRLVSAIVPPLRCRCAGAQPFQITQETYHDNDE